MVAETNGISIQKIHNYTLDGIAMTTQNENNEFYIKNGHGDVIATANEIGTTMNYHSYDAFGNELSPNPYDTDTFRYAGEYFDTETDLIYLRNRYYNSSNGRFITEDPIKDGLNWYAYCGGNPVMMIDPFGLTYKEVAEALDDIIIAKSLMNIFDPDSGSYRVALNNALAAKQKIRDSVIYIEDWSYLRPILSTITEGNDNSVEHIQEVKQAVLQAEKDSEFDKFMLDVSFYGFFVGGAIAAKAGVGTAIVNGATKLIPASATIGQISQQTQSHILQSHHAWEKVVSNPNDWNAVYNVVMQVIRNGVESPYGSALQKTFQINEQTVVVTYKVIENVIRISDAWVKTK